MPFFQILHEIAYGCNPSFQLNTDFTHPIRAVGVMIRPGNGHAVKFACKSETFYLRDLALEVNPNISRVFSGAYVANVKRRCIFILQVQTFAADAPLKTRPTG